MTIQAIISGLTYAEKLAAMELLWRDLSSDASRYQSPEWHERVIADRLMNPAPGMPLPVDESMAEVKGRLDASRTQG